MTTGWNLVLNEASFVGNLPHKSNVLSNNGLRQVKNLNVPFLPNYLLKNT